MSYERSDLGVRVRASLIYERALELTSKLCWKPEDLGLTRVYMHQSREFRSNAALKRYAQEQGSLDSQPKYFFDWLEPIAEHVGIARERYLKDEHWCNREQIINILLDTAMQAYSSESRYLLSELTGSDFRKAELVKVDTTNHARQYVGDPDTMFIDLASENIALMEIKIGHSTTKYSLGQSIKYETLAALLRSEAFFPGFKTHNILLAPHPHFDKSTHGASLLGPSSNEQGEILFSYSAEALGKLNPSGNCSLDDLVRARLRLLSKGRSECVPYAGSNAAGIVFFSWQEAVRVVPDGPLRANLEALMQYLAPSAPNKQLQPTGLGGKHFAKTKSKMLTTEPRG